jgi:hypothetical protein
MPEGQAHAVGATVWSVQTGTRGVVERLDEVGWPVVRFEGSVKAIAVNPTHVMRVDPYADWHSSWARDRDITS